MATGRLDPDLCGHIYLFNISFACDRRLSGRASASPASVGVGANKLPSALSGLRTSRHLKRSTSCFIYVFSEEALGCSGARRFTSERLILLRHGGRASVLAAMEGGGQDPAVCMSGHNVGESRQK